METFKVSNKGNNSIKAWIEVGKRNILIIVVRPAAAVLRVAEHSPPRIERQVHWACIVKIPMISGNRQLTRCLKTCEGNEPSVWEKKSRIHVDRRRKSIKIFFSCFSVASDFRWRNITSEWENAQKRRRDKSIQYQVADFECFCFLFDSVIFGGNLNRVGGIMNHSTWSTERFSYV